MNEQEQRIYDAAMEFGRKNKTARCKALTDPAVFIEQYFAAREVVNTLKAEFGPKISVDLLFKPISGADKLYRAGIDKIDYHVPEKYDRAELERCLAGR